MEININPHAIENRKRWIKKFFNIDSAFVENSLFFEKELNDEVEENGLKCLLDHLHLASDIPEIFKHDSTEEKLYSKYTDALLCQVFKFLGLRSYVLKERSDAADVDGFGKNFNFVADAKAFRLTRTAKNQKDFKVLAMDGWRRDKNFAMVVCPIYQVPNKSSQIYEQATKRNVCIFTYTHLAVLAQYAQIATKEKAEDLLHNIFKVVDRLPISKNASDYWGAINSNMLEFSKDIKPIFDAEKILVKKYIDVAKKITLDCISDEKSEYELMTREEAIKELLKVKKLGSKIKTVENLNDNELLYFLKENR